MTAKPRPKRRVSPVRLFVQAGQEGVGKAGRDLRSLQVAVAMGQLSDYGVF